MKKISIYLLLSLMFSLPSCKDDDDDDKPKITINGITHRDENGKLNGTEDPMDWQLNASFSSEENALFGSDGLALCSGSDTSVTVQAYPNPNDGVFLFQYNSANNPRVAIRLVDENLKVLLAKDSVSGGSIIIQQEKGSGSRMVRLYYRAYYENCKYQGYGDIAIN